MVRNLGCGAVGMVGDGRWGDVCCEVFGDGKCDEEMVMK